MTGFNFLARFGVALVAYLLLGVAGAAAQSGFEILRDTDLPGGDYKAWKQIEYQDCAATCDADIACQAFTYNVQKKVCFLKNRSGQSVRFAGAISGRKAGATAQFTATFEVFDNADIPGGDYMKLRDTGLEQCQQACATQAQCMAFTANVEKRVCFLKSSAGQPERFAGAVAGRRATAQQAASAELRGRVKDGFVVYADADIPGGDGSILDRDSGTAEACQLQCLFSDRCDAFTYNHKAKACLGKSRGHIGGDRMRPTPFQGATSGMKSSQQEVAAARDRYFDSAPKVPEADLAWRENDTAESFVARIRTAAKPMGGACDAERRQMEKIAASVSAGLGTDSAIAGSPVRLEWKATPEENAPPLWLMVSVDTPSRFAAEGFYALTPGAIAPFGLSADRDRTRALTTLFGKGALDKGMVDITALVAGTSNVAVRAVGWLRDCEKEFSQEIVSASLSVLPSPQPTFQVRDPFSFEVPSKVWLSPDGATKLEVFDGRFRVVDIETGAFIADREGRDPHYSPTGRFVSFGTDEDGGGVIDAVDGAEVVNDGGISGWENNDSFLVVGRDGYGQIGAYSLVGQGAVVGSWGAGCRGCGGGSVPYRLDLENDFAHVGGEEAGPFADGSGDQRRLSGAKHPSKIIGYGRPAARQFAAIQTAAAPVSFPTEWDFRGGLKLAPYMLSYQADGREPSPEEREEQAHMFHAEELAQGESSAQVAGLQPVAVGQWRGAVRLDRQNAASDGDMAARLSEFGLKFSKERAPAFAKPSPRSGNPFDVKGGFEPDLASRIEESVPGAEGVFVSTGDAVGCAPYEPDGAGKGTIYSIFDNAVQWKIGDRSIWLTNFQCTDGNSAAGIVSNFYLFDSHHAEPILYLECIQSNVELGPGAVCNDSNFLLGTRNFASRLYADRYLLIWSTQSRAIVLFDIDQRKTLWIESDLGRADLFKEAFYSVEANHVTQVNTDGSFYVYDVPGKKRVMEGRYVDDEVIAWTPDLRFDASPEGANYVNLRFPGQRGQYAFQQFARAVKRPGLVGEVFARAYVASAQALPVPPRLDGRLEGKGERIAGSVYVTGAVELRVHQDGLVTDTIAVLPGQASVSVDVARVPGARWVSLVAYDSTGIASLPVGQEFPPDDGALPVMHALTVGIDRYSGAGLQQLRYANRDAATLLGAIEAQNDKSLRLGITSNLADEAATPDAILAKAGEMVASAGKGETIVFSFAGHGVTGPDGRFFLATSETDAANIAGTALAWDRLAAIFAKSQARVIVFLDACHSGAAGTGLFATNDDAAGEVLEGVPSGLLVFSASKGRQASEESAAAGGGLFTNAVADVIARERGKHDLDGNGAIEISELYAGVKLTVSSQTEGRQVPWLARNELVGDFTIF